MKTGLAMLAMCAFCGLSGKLEAADRQDSSRPAAAVADEGDQLPSVILDLHKAKSEFDKHFSENLEPEMERMGQAFAAMSRGPRNCWPSVRRTREARGFAQNTRIAFRTESAKG